MRRRGPGKEAEAEVSVGPAVAPRRRVGAEGAAGGPVGSRRYSRKSNEREPNEAILKGDIVGSFARRTNSITSSGIERRKREEAHGATLWTAARSGLYRRNGFITNIRALFPCE